MFFFNLILLAVGFYALVKGADIFVDGSTALARNFQVPGLIIGLTIVAFGTSAPELAVSTTAALQGANEIALSNVIGSNIFNLLCVLGACALIHPVPVDKGILKRDFPLSLLVTLFVLAATVGNFAFTGSLFSAKMEETVGTVCRAAGLLLVIVFAVYISYLICDARKHPENEEETETQPVWKCGALIAFGLVLIVCGGQAVVYSAKEIARTLGMTETLIGLTIVAVGTSLPEFVTSIVAARKGETGLAVGNVIGSNIFNLMFILGISALIRPIGVNCASVHDLVILIIISVISFIFSLSATEINRREGFIMILIYMADVVFAAMR